MGVDNGSSATSTSTKREVGFLHQLHLYFFSPVESDRAGQFIRFITDSSTYLSWACNFTFHPSNLLQPQIPIQQPMPAGQTGVPQAADAPFQFQRGLLKPASKSASSGYLACIHLRADTHSKASISHCICLNMSQEVGAEHAVAGNISDTRPKKQEGGGRNWKPRQEWSNLGLLLPIFNIINKQRGNCTILFTF